MEEATRPGGSWAVQGCLFGSVALFAILLVVLVFLAYTRFREQTQQPPPPPPTSGIEILDAEVDPFGPRATMVAFASRHDARGR